MFQAIYQLIAAFFPFLEIVILGFFLGIGFQSSATGIVAIIFLLVVNYFWSEWVKPIAWVVAIFQCLQLTVGDMMWGNLAISCVLGLIRFMLMIKK